MNKELINFDEKILKVGNEEKDRICIGNTSKNLIKVQLTLKKDNDKFEIRTDPQLVTLKNNQACEFEIFIKPLCTCNINDEILILVSDLKKGDQNKQSIQIQFETELSTKLDPDELKEEKKIGEGSFGIVYLGTFRGNKVAIKKIKELDDDKMKEFSEEVSMLDKFRSEYIIHFYGAVFIPKKMCMVTEFAQFGSLQDLMKKKKTKTIELKLRIKMMIDAAKGIQYLHSNGILHRDIKPDNILVVSLTENDMVNAKLTDFGTSRNINMLMTNMTFTKGIGSPKYMAPEILNRKKYKMPSDVYSFAVTMLRSFTWKNPFPKDLFQFAWNVADYIAKGGRPKLINEVEESLNHLGNKTQKKELKLEISLLYWKPTIK